MSGLRGFTSPLWPIRYKPLPDELLSSWIVRLAHGHGLKVQTFCNRLFGNTRQVWNRDMDRLAPDWLIEALVTHTGASQEDVFRTTLRRYEGVLYERFRSSGHLHWIQVMQMYHRKRAGFGQQYCPCCLSEDDVPYFRLRWRLSLVTLCKRHQCLLLDRCFNCGVSISFHRVDIGVNIDESLSLASCFHCGANLATANPTAVPNYDSDATDWLQAMVGRIEDDDFGHQGVLGVLHHLSYLMLSSSMSVRLNDYVAGCMEIVPISMVNRGRTVIESLPVSERHQVLMQAAWMMIDLEGRMLNAWRNKAIRYNHCLRDFGSPPNWYLHIVGKMPHNRRGGLYSDEVRNCVAPADTRGV